MGQSEDNRKEGLIIKRLTENKEWTRLSVYELRSRFKLECDDDSTREEDMAVDGVEDNRGQSI